MAAAFVRPWRRLSRLCVVPASPGPSRLRPLSAARLPPPLPRVMATAAPPRPLDGLLRRQLATAAAAAAATSAPPAVPSAAAPAPVRLVGERTVTPASAAARAADIPVRTYRVVARPGTNYELEYDSYGDESHMPGIVRSAYDLRLGKLGLTAVPPKRRWNAVPSRIQLSCCTAVRPAPNVRRRGARGDLTSDPPPPLSSCLLQAAKRATRGRRRRSSWPARATTRWRWT